MTVDELSTLVSKYALRGVCIDTNLLLLIAIGFFDRDRIEAFKRTRSKGYRISDFEFLVKLLSKFQKRITTPGILTEVDNLGRQLDEREHRAFATALSKLIEDMIEIHEPGKEIVRHPEYIALGLTDAAVHSLSIGTLIVTDDFRLAGKISALNRDVININHLRRFS